jgi:hypothetical protein
MKMLNNKSNLQTVDSESTAWIEVAEYGENSALVKYETHRASLSIKI